MYELNLCPYFLLWRRQQFELALIIQGAKHDCTYHYAGGGVGGFEGRFSTTLNSGWNFRFQVQGDEKVFFIVDA